MPYHLELGSEGHSFNGQAIVVNSKTGMHLTLMPVDKDVAKVIKEHAEKDPAFIAGEKEIAEEADKKVKALAGLRKVESDTKERNTKREQEATAKRPFNRIAKAFFSGQRKVEMGWEYLLFQVLSGVGDLKEKDIEKYIRSVLTRLMLMPINVDAELPVRVRKDGDKWEVQFLGRDIDANSILSSALSYKDYVALKPKVKAEFEALIKLHKDNLANAKAKEKADREAKEAEDEKGRKAKLDEAETKRKSKSGMNDRLTEFMTTEAEDLTGVDYGNVNREGKRQQGVITHFLGDPNPVRRMIEQSHSSNATLGAAELIGLIHTLSLVADKRDSNKIERKREEYGRSMIDPKEVETPADKYYDRSVRLLVNHFPKLKTGGDPKDLKSPLGFLILPPTTKALETLRGLLPGVRLGAGHITGGIHGASKDKYEYAVDTAGLNLRTKAGKDELEKKRNTASEKATDLLNSFFVQLREGAYLYLEKTAKATQEKKAVLKASGMTIPKGEKNKAEVPLTREGLYDMSLSITGDETRAKKYADDNLSDYQAKGRAGKKLYVYLARTSYHLVWV